MKKKQTLKPVKAWAIKHRTTADGGWMALPDVFKTKEQALRRRTMASYQWIKRCSVVPVLITPLPPKKKPAKIALANGQIQRLQYHDTDLTP